MRCGSCDEEIIEGRYHDCEVTSSPFGRAEAYDPEHRKLVALWIRVGLLAVVAVVILLSAFVHAGGGEATPPAPALATVEHDAGCTTPDGTGDPTLTLGIAAAAGQCAVAGTDVRFAVFTNDGGPAAWLSAGCTGGAAYGASGDGWAACGDDVQVINEVAARLGGTAAR
jgi:hypothetical protein